MLFQLPLPRGFLWPLGAEAPWRGGGSLQARDPLPLGLSPAPVQLVGGEMSCISVVPEVSPCHREKLECCSYSWEISQFSLYTFPVGHFFPLVWANHSSGR